MSLAVSHPSRAGTSDTHPSPARNFDVQKVAEGVYAVIRKDLPGMMVDANNVFLVGEEDVIVVDTSGAPAITREVLAALRSLTPKPVRYVINTHWHDDHISGNSVYREAFPGVEFIGHAAMREYLPERGAAARKDFLEGAPKFLAHMKDLFAKGKSLGGTDLTAEERASYQSDFSLIELVLAEAPSVKTILPTLTVEDRLVLHRGPRTIEVRQLARGHTAADLIVHLPKEGIVITGDLVVWPVPLVGGEQSHIGDWVLALDRLQSLRPRILIPGHGPVLRDDSYIKQLRELFTSVMTQTEAAVRLGETLERTRKSVDLSSLRARFAGDSGVRKALFDNYAKGPAVEAAFREATAKAR